MRSLSFAVIFVVFVVFAAIASEQQSYVPDNGIVPDAATAIKIAEAVWLPIYGERVLLKKPFNAELIDGVWVVTGTLPEGIIGGVPVAEISKVNGEIIRISHGK